MTDLTESIRDKIEELRRTKQKRYEQICHQLDTEIHQKTNLSREIFRKFEQAVTVYQRESEAPEVPSAEPTHSRSHVDKEIAEVADQIMKEFEEERGNEKDHEAESAVIDPETNGSLATFQQVTIGTITGSDYVSRDSPPLAAAALSEPVDASSLDKVPVNEKANENNQEDSGVRVTPKQKAVRKAHDHCVELRRQNELVEESLRKARARLLFAREDYQRSLQQFDDLEEELTKISETFEENQKRALENFFTGLNDKDTDVYEEYRKFQESANHEMVRQSQKRQDVGALESEVHRAKRVRNVALVTSLVAIAPWLGQAALMLWEKYLLYQQQFGI